MQIVKWDKLSFSLYKSSFKRLLLFSFGIGYIVEKKVANKYTSSWHSLTKLTLVYFHFQQTLSTLGMTHTPFCSCPSQKRKHFDLKHYCCLFTEAVYWLLFLLCHNSWKFSFIFAYLNCQHKGQTLMLCLHSFFSCPLLLLHRKWEVIKAKSYRKYPKIIQIWGWVMDLKGEIFWEMFSNKENICFLIYPIVQFDLL